MNKQTLNLLYYDNYTQANKVFDNSNNSKLGIGSNTSYTEAMPTTYSLLLRGCVPDLCFCIFIVVFR